ncbi:MAG: TonB-dependent receptor [Caulobacteraceae bacterium]
MRSCVSVIALGAALGVTAAAHAATPNDDSTTVEELVVSAAPYAVSLNSTTTHIEVLKAEQLDTAPLGGLGDVLSDTPGVRSTSFGPGASRPVIRGLSGARVLVLENGVGMVDASTLSPDHAVASDPAQASRIEVLRGPSALAYGGAGIGGVVNVIDERIPRTQPEGGVDGRVVASAQSGDDALAASGYAKIGVGRFVFAVDGSARRSSDYHVPVPPVSERYAAAHGLTPIDTDTVGNTAVSESGWGVGGSYIADSGAYIGLSAKRSQTVYGIPVVEAAGGPPDEEGPVSIHMHQWRYDLRGETPADLWLFEKVRGSLGYADYEHAEVLEDTGETGTTFLSHGVEGRLELVHKEHDGHKGAVGVQFTDRDIQAIGDEAFIPPVNAASQGLFTLQRWERDNYGFDFGLRYDHTKLTTPTASRAFDNVSASIGAFYRPTEPLFLALSVSSVGRSPTEFELFANGPHPGTGGYEVGDPTLEAERVASVEGTARFKGGRFTLEGSVFYARYDGYIDEIATGAVEDGLPVFQFTQVGAEFFGGEFHGDYRLWEGGDKALKLEASYDWVRGSTDLGPPARIPPWALTGRLVWTQGDTEASLEVRHMAEQTRLSARELPTDAYTMINASLEARPFANKSVKVFLDGRNLNDVEAREAVSFLKDIAPLPGREIRLGASYDF